MILFHEFRLLDDPHPACPHQMWLREGQPIPGEAQSCLNGKGNDKAEHVSPQTSCLFRFAHAPHRSGKVRSPG